jgi:hypothetical protein
MTGRRAALTFANLEGSHRNKRLGKAPGIPYLTG